MFQKQNQLYQWKYLTQINEINKGEADIDQVLKDILALTKFNYNTCIYADGVPVTIRFADKIGSILTASIV